MHSVAVHTDSRGVFCNTSLPRPLPWEAGRPASCIDKVAARETMSTIQSLTVCHPAHTQITPGGPGWGRGGGLSTCLLVLFSFVFSKTLYFGLHHSYERYVIGMIHITHWVSLYHIPYIILSGLSLTLWNKREVSHSDKQNARFHDTVALMSMVQIRIPWHTFFFRGHEGNLW